MHHPAESLTAYHCTLLRSLMFFFHFSQPSEPHHDFTMVFHTSIVSHIFFLLKPEKTREYKRIFHIFLKIFSTCCLPMQNSFTDVTQLEENVVFTETFYAEEKSIKKEMTYQRKPRVHSLIAEFWRLQRNNYYFVPTHQRQPCPETFILSVRTKLNKAKVSENLGECIF